MKTNSSSNSSSRKHPGSRLPSRPDHQPQQHTEPEAALPPIDRRKRRTHRGLRTEQVLALLQEQAPGFCDKAEVVGRWIWIAFPEKQPREITAQLAELGFHWNNKRALWQHPCGQTAPGTDHDPRQKYPSYFPADTRTT